MCPSLHTSKYSSSRPQLKSLHTVRRTFDHVQLRNVHLHTRGLSHTRSPPQLKSLHTVRSYTVPKHTSAHTWSLPWQTLRTSNYSTSRSRLKSVLVEMHTHYPVQLLSIHLHTRGLPHAHLCAHQGTAPVVSPSAHRLALPPCDDESSSQDRLVAPPACVYIYICVCMCA